jgi:DNA-directed RNA polymerase specialized sigma subunit
MRGSLRTFVEHIAATHVSSLFRRTRAKKRTKHDANGESMHVLVTIELRVDLWRVLGKLETRERKVAQLLAQNHSPTQISRRLRISRPAVYRSIARIREALSPAGFC